MPRQLVARQGYVGDSVNSRVVLQVGCLVVLLTVCSRDSKPVEAPQVLWPERSHVATDQQLEVSDAILVGRLNATRPVRAGEMGSQLVRASVLPLLWLRQDSSPLQKIGTADFTVTYYGWMREDAAEAYAAVRRHPRMTWFTGEVMSPESGGVYAWFLSTDADPMRPIHDFASSVLRITSGSGWHVDPTDDTASQLAKILVVPGESFDAEEFDIARALLNAEPFVRRSTIVEIARDVLRTTSGRYSTAVCSWAMDHGVLGVEACFAGLAEGEGIRAIFDEPTTFPGLTMNRSSRYALREKALVRAAQSGELAAFLKETYGSADLTELVDMLRLHPNPDVRQATRTLPLSSDRKPGQTGNRDRL